VSELRIPHHGADEPTLDVIGSLRHMLPDREERRVVRQVLTDRMLAGDERIGDVLDHLGRMSTPACAEYERKAMPPEIKTFEV
jgi:hypothetical protein